METKPRSRRHEKFYKWLTVTFVLSVLFLLFAYLGVHQTSQSKFCASCHNLSPEVYTWKASSHSKVECTQCHIAPGMKNLAIRKVMGVKEVYAKITDSYPAQIVSNSDIPDKSCERCHKMKNRNVSPSGDLIIPHNKHKDKKVPCVKCHSGVAHGEIDDRGANFKTDYDKWDKLVGIEMMKDVKHTRPKMSTCMNCHEAKQAPLNCDACHKTKMLPYSHRDKKFVQTGLHGRMAFKELQECNICHSYMSKKPVPEFKVQSASDRILGNAAVGIKSKDKQLIEYAKTNTYCIDCHKKRPNSHAEKDFEHWKLVKKQPDRCFTCHDYKIVSKDQKYVTKVTCGSCHPATHTGYDFVGHPIPVDTTIRPRVQEVCADCHTVSYCVKCHTQDAIKKK
ncbi:MAG: NapC/NirT cytochrome c domain protein [Bacillales bacterium]|nr:NapC/NirT cytochrome c domain protein [Bacillales bacterium]